MRTVLDIPVDRILPEATRILEQQGVPAGTAGVENLLAVADAARAELAELLDPAGVLSEVTREEFDGIYPGLGSNDPSSPLELIFPLADELALFAVTCGETICERIAALFSANEFPLGAALDAGASLAADQAAQVAQDMFAVSLEKESAVIRYSPGYCGWHVSGQKALFSFLGPESAGIHLTDGFMMHPLKSVSGVIIAGRPEIHHFANDYPFCTACKGKECRDRIESVSAFPRKEI